MKIRNGFVSNSSSSSFIIYFKGNREELKKRLYEIFELNSDYPIRIDGGEFAECIFDNIDEDINTYEAYIEDYGIEDKELEELLDRKSQGYQFYMGSVSNDSGNAIENLLCDSEINYIHISDDLIIEKEGGY